MKILVICQYYYPENFQITPICEQLVKDGYDVTVLTGLPNYPTGIIPDEYKRGHRKEKVNGVKILRVYERGRQSGVVGLALNYGSFVATAMRMVIHLHRDYDLVFCYQLSPVTMAIPAMKFAKRNRIPYLHYVCDLWPESMKIHISNELNPVYRVTKFLSRVIYRSADKLVVQSTSFIDYLESVHGIDRDEIVYIPAFADESYLSEDFTPDDDTIDFVFLGNLGIAQDLLSILKAVESIKDMTDFRVHFVGDGTCFTEMKNYVKGHNLENIVCFYGRRPVEEMSKFYKLADACLVSLRADNATGLSLPLKVQGYMAAGKMIIGMMNGSAKDVIEESGCGRCVPAGDIKSLSEAMRDFIINKEKYYKCGENGRAYFKSTFTKKIFMNKLENLMEAMILV